MFLLSSLSTPLLGQTVSGQDEIVAEGRLLYTLEKASWNGTDEFLARFVDRASGPSGYFSYVLGQHVFCIFFADSPLPHVIASIAFKSDHPSYATNVDSTSREFSPYEQNLYTLRKRTEERIRTDTSIKWFKNTRFNIDPIIKDSVREVYIISATAGDSDVVFGGDYVCYFDEENAYRGTKKLHASMLRFPLRVDSANVAYHTHGDIAGDLITPTDICTIMLYSPLTKWNQYYVISEKYVSMWSCSKEDLRVLTREVWDRIGGFKMQKR